MAHPCGARRSAGRFSGSLRARASRQDAFLPVRIQHPAGEFLATTRDLSDSGLSLIAPSPVKPGSVIRVILRGPAGEWSSPATVVRVSPVHSPVSAYRTWHVGLRIDGHTSVVGLRHQLAPEVVS